MTILLREQHPAFWPKYAKFLINDFQGLLNKHKLKIDACGISALESKWLFNWMLLGNINRSQLKEICEKAMLRRKAADVEKEEDNV